MMVKQFADAMAEKISLTLPEGCDSWGVKTVDCFSETRNGFYWPSPGGGVNASWGLEGVDVGRFGSESVKDYYAE